MKNFIKSSVIISGTELALILIGIIRSKYLAEQIGAEGLGIYSLLSSFFLMLSSFCGGWLGVVYVKYVAEYHRKGYVKAIQKIHNFSFSLTLLLTLFTLGLLLIWRSFFKEFFLSPEILDFHYAIFLGVFIMSSLRYIYEYYLNAVQSYSRTMSARILTISVEFLLTLLLVYFFKLSGFFISLLLSAISGLIILNAITRRSVKTYFQLSFIKSPVTATIFKFGSINFFLLLIGNLSQYVYRILILNNFDMEQVGFFHAITSLITYLGLFNKGTNYSYVPAMGQDITVTERNYSLNQYLQINIPISAFISICGLLFFKEAITVLYTQQFQSLASISPYFILAQFLTVIVIAFQSIVVGTNRYKVHTIAVIGTNILWIAIPFIFIEKLGMIAIALGMIAASTWSITFNFLYLRRTLHTSIPLSTIVSFFVSLILILSAVNLKDFNIYVKVGFEIFAGVIIFFLLPKSLKQKLYPELKTVRSKSTKF